MPSIKDAQGADLSGYTPMTAQLPVITRMITDKAKANPSRRCPLPPFNSDPDTLRQFEIGTQSPLIRVIPLPEVTNTAAPTFASTAASVASSSSTVVPVATTLTALSVTLSTGVLAAGSSFTGSVQMKKSFQLLSLAASAVCEVRLYGTAAAQSFDNGRVGDVPVPAETSQNIISCVTFDTLPYAWPWQNKIAANQDTPQSSTVYISVFNTDVSTVSNINVVISYLPLES